MKAFLTFLHKDPNQKLVRTGTSLGLYKTTSDVCSNDVWRASDHTILLYGASCAHMTPKLPCAKPLVSQLMSSTHLEEFIGLS